MYADLMLTQGQLLEEYDSAKPQRQADIAEQLDSIGKILEGEGGEDYTDDPLIDKWEREIAEGRVPDLDEEDDINA